MSGSNSARGLGGFEMGAAIVAIAIVGVAVGMPALAIPLALIVLVAFLVKRHEDNTAIQGYEQALGRKADAAEREQFLAELREARARKGR